MKKLNLKEIKEELHYAKEHWKLRKRITIKTMAEYLRQVHPELEVLVDGSSCFKYRKAGRLRSSGQSYGGHILIVKDKRGNTIIHHNTAETYRMNYEVAMKIAEYEESKGD